jgi:hypothetical protein
METSTRRVMALTCAAALVASLAACGGGGDKSAQPNPPSSSKAASGLPTPTATSGPATIPSTTPPTTTGPAALPAHSTYNYRGLTFVVNVPADISSASLPRMRVFSDFLQGLGRTTAQNKLDPSLSKLASPAIVKYIQTFVEPGSVQGVGSMTITVSKVETLAPGPTQVTGCLASKLVQVRKDGSRFVDLTTRKYPTLKMTASISPQDAVLPVDQFAFAAGTC